MAGRKKDDIWIYFNEEPTFSGKGVKAKCKNCGKVIMGIVARLKKHVEQCLSYDKKDDDDNQLYEKIITSETGASTSTNVKTEVLDIGRKPTKRKMFEIENDSKKNMNSYVIKTSKTQKQMLDEEVARYIYATNSAFHHVQHPQFKKMISALRPGYTAPNEVEIGGSLLDNIYSQEKEKCSEYLSGQIVNLSIDGWSNVHNEPILCAVVTNKKGENYLLETIDTSGCPHTIEYLIEVVKNCMIKCENEFKCIVRSVVTDNANNVKGMRTEIQSNPDFDLITYGCSAHLLNLLAEDLNIPNIKEQILHIVKFFRNNHFANAKYREAGGSKLIIPQEVRWNTMADCVSAYLKNWPILVSVCEENRCNIDSIVYNKVTNFGIKRNAEDLLKRLKPISIALDKMQQKDCTISTAVDIWKNLQEELTEVNLDKTCLKSFSTRYNQALGPPHFLAYLLDPRYAGIKLSAAEKSECLIFAKEKYSQSVVPTLMKFQAKSEPFHQFLFDSDIVNKVNPIDWWKSQITENDGSGKNVIGMISQLFTAQASSASVERIFSTFGLVHSKLRNRLGTDKAGKLVFLFKQFNNKQ